MTKKELRKIPDRFWLKSDKNVSLIAFYPFRDFYGGYLVYEIPQINAKENPGRCRYKQWIGNKMARKLGVKEEHIYGHRIS